MESLVLCNFKRKLKHTKWQRGSLFIELLIALAISAIIIPATVMVLVGVSQGSVRRERRIQATELLSETSEIVRLLKKTNWSNVDLIGTYFPQESGSTWTLQSGSGTRGNYSYSVTFSNVFRNSAGEIVPFGGTVDPGSKNAQVTVSWLNPLPGSTSQSFLLTRYDEPAELVETTDSDFEDGEFDETTLTSDNGGEVLLASGGSGSWCSPGDSIVANLNLPKNGSATSLWAVEGQVFAGTGENASGVSAALVTASQTNPPELSIDKTIDGYKTNAVFTDGTYSYIATDTNSSEVVIIDTTTTPMSAVGYVDIPGSQDAEDIYVVDDTGYVIQGRRVWTFDVSSKLGSRPVVDPGGQQLAGVAQELVVDGTYVYVAVDSSTALQIVDASNPSSMNIVGSVVLSGQTGSDVSLNASANRAYLATKGSPSYMHVVDISTKSGALPIVGSYNTQGMSPNSTLAVSGNKVLVAGQNAEEYQVVDVSVETNPTYCGGFDFNTGVNDVVGVIEEDGDVFSYVLTQDSSAELQVVEGGPGGSFSLYGTFTSAPVDMGIEVLWHQFIPLEIQPFTTTVSYQFAGADPVNGNCDDPTYEFVGPDGTNTTWFDGAASVPLEGDGTGYENPSQCFRYRAAFTTSDSTTSPIFEEARLTYSY